MSLFASTNGRLRLFISLTVGLFCSLVTLAQVNLTYRLLNGYSLSNDAPINKGKPTLFVFEQDEPFGQVFKSAVTSKRPDGISFSKELVIGIVLPPTTKPPKLSVSKVFVQDSTLTVRYIRMADTTSAHNPQSVTSQPMLLFTIPKQAILKTKLVENGKVVQLAKRHEND